MWSCKTLSVYVISIGGRGRIAGRDHAMLKYGREIELDNLDKPGKRISNAHILGETFTHPRGEQLGHVQ